MLVKLYVSRPEILSDSQLADISLFEFQISHLFGGFTKYENATRVWVNYLEDDEYRDVVDVYEVLIPHELASRKEVITTFTTLAKEFGQLLGQKCIPFTILESENHFVDIDKKEENDA